MKHYRKIIIEVYTEDEEVLSVIDNARYPILKDAIATQVFNGKEEEVVSFDFREGEGTVL